MVTLDVLPPITAAPLALAMKAPANRPSPDGLYGVVGACALVVGAVKDGISGEGLNVTKILSPGNEALQLFWHRQEDPLLNSIEVQEEASHSSKTTVIGQPIHGKVVWLGDKGKEVNFGAENSFAYEPNKGYVGADRVTFMTELAGRRIKVVYFIRVTKDVIEIDSYRKLYEKYCPKATWQISKNEEIPSYPTPWLQSASLSALLSAASTIPVSFAPLPASTLGQTLGVGEGAQITLDDNAAGHGWYIDPTPLDNADDYLPTSDPRLWQAKPGSASEGKMDLLSVLLHELGHALGEEHSEHASDYMATSLQSGQRKLPSAQEIEHLLALSAALHPSKQPLPHVPHGFTAITSIASVEPLVSTTLCGGLGGTGLTS